MTATKNRSWNAYCLVGQVLGVQPYLRKRLDVLVPAIRAYDRYFPDEGLPSVWKRQRQPNAAHFAYLFE